MSAPVSVSNLTVKSHNNPDETRALDKTRVEVVRLDGYTLARLNLEPGWRWSECVKPAVGTDSCQISHVGYLVSGQFTVQMSDGSSQVIRAGDAYTIPPGHDAWVDGNETAVALEVLSAEQFANPRS